MDQQIETDIALSADSATDTDVTHIRKLRRCLMCSTSFTSQWSGERICPRCRSTSAWRSGSD